MSCLRGVMHFLCETVANLTTTTVTIFQFDWDDNKGGVLYCLNVRSHKSCTEKHQLPKSIQFCHIIWLRSFRLLIGEINLFFIIIIAYAIFNAVQKHRHTTRFKVLHMWTWTNHQKWWTRWGIEHFFLFEGWSNRGKGFQIFFQLLKIFKFSLHTACTFRGTPSFKLNWQIICDTDTYVEEPITRNTLFGSRTLAEIPFVKQEW